MIVVDQISGYYFAMILITLFALGAYFFIAKR